MNDLDQKVIVTIALAAALADGRQDPREATALKAVADAAGITDLDGLARDIAAGTLRPADLARQLSDDQARRLAYQTALVACHADGPPSEAEQRFLDELRVALGQEAPPAGAPAAELGSGTPPGPELDDMILRQSMLAAALELLPERLATMAIIPLQLRLVYLIGQRHGQQLDANQVKDLAGTFGIGAAAQVMEGVVRGVLGSLTKGIFGGAVGGAAGVAAGAAVTFASTYALGHVATQYYAQGRRLSTADLIALFARFQEEARSLFPKVQEQIQAQSRTLNLQTVLATIQGR
ncbi:MAG: GTPase, partial [Gemmatimonadetes bacterium]|nr:GTPase [Gemmatimonadota bacterium]